MTLIFTCACKGGGPTGPRCQRKPLSYNLIACNAKNTLDTWESFYIQLVGDKAQPYLDYRTIALMHEDQKEVHEVLCGRRLLVHKRF